MQLYTSTIRYTLKLQYKTLTDHANFIPDDTVFLLH